MEFFRGWHRVKFDLEKSLCFAVRVIGEAYPSVKWGVSMFRQASAAALLVFASLVLASCSGVPHGGCVSNCGGGNATVSFVLTATPPDPTLALSIQAFRATITGITLTPATGTAVNVTLNSNSYVAEFNRVTSDSTLLAAQVSVPAGTYTQVQVFFSDPSLTFCTQVNPGVPGCTAGTLASVGGTGGSATISTNLTFAANQQTGIALNANLASALTFTGQTISAVNLAAAGAFTANTLPPSSTQTDLGSGELSHVDDVMGLVTSVSGSTLTLQTSTRGTITATANSSTQFSSDCSTQTFNGCVLANTVAIVDTILNADGTLTLTFFQPLAFSSDIVEGVVTGVPNSVTNQFTVVVTDSVFAGNGSILSSQVHLGDQVLVTLTSPNPFQIVSKGLQVPIGSSFENSTSVAAIQPGQTVAFPALTFTAQSGVTPGSATAKDLALRFTRITATLGSVSSPTFSATTFPPFFGITVPQQFQTTSGRLSLDGVSNLASLSAGATFSTTALFVGPPVAPQFSAQSVRAH